MEKREFQFHCSEDSNPLFNCLRHKTLEFDDLEATTIEFLDSFGEKTVTQSSSTKRLQQIMKKNTFKIYKTFQLVHFGTYTAVEILIGTLSLLILLGYILEFVIFC